MRGSCIHALTFTACRSAVEAGTCCPLRLAPLLSLSCSAVYDGGLHTANGIVLVSHDNRLDDIIKKGGQHTRKRGTQTHGLHSGFRRAAGCGGVLQLRLPVAATHSRRMRLLGAVLVTVVPTSVSCFVVSPRAAPYHPLVAIPTTTAPGSVDAVRTKSAPSRRRRWSATAVGTDADDLGTEILLEIKGGIQVR